MMMMRKIQEDVRKRFCSPPEKMSCCDLRLSNEVEKRLDEMGSERWDLMMVIFIAVIMMLVMLM